MKEAIMKVAGVGMAILIVGTIAYYIFKPTQAQVKNSKTTIESLDYTNGTP